MRKISFVFLLSLIAAIGFSSCYHRRAEGKKSPVEYSAEELDSLLFLQTHHYGQNYNFIVRTDSLELIRQLPEEQINALPTDTFAVPRHVHLVVADIRILPADTIDSVWVQVALNQDDIGWTHESELLANVDPDDPISQFISIFSNVHLLVFLIVILLIGIAYLLRALLRRHAYIVHFNDISSFYPTLLALTVATSATLYSSIQYFVPETWRHFYFHPTLNPFACPPLLMVFLISVWLIIIVGLAAVDDTFRHLRGTSAILYLLGLMAICALNYIIFTITTYYYIGYLLYVAYVCFALWRYFRYSRMHYICGNCGARMKKKGHCPQCGIMNK